MRPSWSASPDGNDADALQTDVMRFMAILGLCLAAIFSLLQSAAVTAPEPVGKVEEPVPAVPVASNQTAGSTPDPVIAEPRPARQSVHSTPEPVPVRPEPPEPPATPTDKNEPEGFSLGFESVAALHALLRSDQARLYALSADVHWRLQEDGVTFAREPAPGAYYEMDARTVPASLQQLLGAAAGEGASRWGITLPSRTRAELSELMATHTGGELRIAADGGVALATQ